MIFTLPMRNWNLFFSFLVAQANTSFLPYLWGIETDEAYIEDTLGLKIFTLPMRNWNLLEGELGKEMIVKFLPYLWGIETYLARFSMRLGRRFLPYLWGIETISRGL